MNIEGTYTLQAPPDMVWKSFKDLALLQQALPGLERIEHTSTNTYSLVIHISYAPLKSSYHGRVSITPQPSPYHCRLNIENQDEHNVLKGFGTLYLHERAGNTIITYKGNLTISNQGVRLPPQVVKGAVKLLLQQFFTALSDRLRLSSLSVSSLQKTAMPHTLQLVEEERSMDPLEQAVKNRTMFSTLVDLLKLGKGDPEQAAQWEQRLRRLSIASGLLLLVWIGTRLPRRN